MNNHFKNRQSYHSGQHIPGLPWQMTIDFWSREVGCDEHRVGVFELPRREMFVGVLLQLMMQTIILLEEWRNQLDKIPLSKFQAKFLA